MNRTCAHLGAELFVLYPDRQCRVEDIPMYEPRDERADARLRQRFADITGTIDQKIAAISCHRSQMGRLDAESGRDLARAVGRISGFPYAEVFEVLRVRI
jgi:LmbE family N-acetylglucosaminyl deacetylase